MKRSLILLFLLCLVTQISSGQLWKQKRWYLTGGVGPSFFFGDVGGYTQGLNILGFKDMSFLQTRFNLNANMKYRFTQEINGRVSFTYGMFHATDERGSNQERGYESTINFFEPLIIGEYYFIKNRTERSWLFVKRRSSNFGSFFKALDFYFLTGFGGISYTIKPNDALAATNPVTSGFAPVLPVGVGSSIILTPDVDLGVEISGRYAFTDNLDGYTSQYSNSNDVYYFLNFTFTYKLKTNPNGWPAFR
jgi:hypothetical protein